MDHSWPPGLVDGVFAEAWAVRDLGSGMQLAWQAVPDETAETTAAILERLIREHGPPLIIRSDNGPAFKSEELSNLLAEYRIAWLPSPLIRVLAGLLLPFATSVELRNYSNIVIKCRGIMAAAKRATAR